MSSPTDPIKALRRSRLLVDLIAVAACIGLATLWITGRDRSGTAGPEDSAANETASVPEPTASEPFPIEAFSVSLWYSAPEPVPAVVERPPPAPRLRLLGIRDTGSGYLAMLLDETTDDIIRAVQGDDVGGVLLTSVDESGVRGTYRGSEIELRLDGGDG